MPDIKIGIMYKDGSSEVLTYEMGCVSNCEMYCAIMQACLEISMSKVRGIAFENITKEKKHKLAD